MLPCPWLLMTTSTHGPAACASRLPGTWLALQETTCWDRRVQREPSCLAMLRKQMPPPAHASLHPPVPTAPALLGANTSGCGVLMPTEQDTHTHTYTHAHTHGNQTPSSCLKMSLARVSASHPQRFLVTGMAGDGHFCK